MLAAAAELEAVSLRAIDAIEDLAKAEGVVFGSLPTEPVAAASPVHGPADGASQEAPLPADPASPKPDPAQPEANQPAST